MPKTKTRKPDPKNYPKKDRPDIYAEVTDKIIKALEAGVRPWQKPWQAGGLGSVSRPLRANGQPYRGINVFLLWDAANQNGFSSPYWFTFKQASDFGAHVRKGEKGSTIVKAGKFTKEEANPDTGKVEEKDIFYMKGYVVFNADQIDGLPEKYLPKPIDEATDKPQRLAHAEAFFANTGAKVTYGGERAFYRPSTDEIRVPDIDRFKDVGAFYATLGHETVHWTGHDSRLARKFDRFGSNDYAAEELVAELGAAFLCADLGLELDVRDDHAAYIDNWLEVLKKDKRFIFTASSAAQKALDFLHELQPGAKDAPASVGEEGEIEPAADGLEQAA
jgi:antirestriction protein ArdC